MESVKKLEDTELPRMKKLRILKLLQKSRFSVYIVEDPTDKGTYVIKVFPSVDMGVSPSYLNESRYKDLSHPNVIKILQVNPKELMIYEKKQDYVSYILMEYAKHGTLRILMTKMRIHEDEKLARSFFKQIVAGLEYLHSQKMAHLDLKLENILIGSDYLLKVADFDTAVMMNDVFVLGRGTSNYRAPELKNKKCKKVKAADIYSLGILLFTLRYGVLPYAEDILVNKFNLMLFMTDSPDNFWKAHYLLSEGKVDYDSEFADLFHAMTRIKPEARIGFEEIKKSYWFNGPTYEQSVLQAIIKDALE